MSVCPSEQSAAERQEFTQMQQRVAARLKALGARERHLAAEGALDAGPEGVAGLRRLLAEVDALRADLVQTLVAAVAYGKS